MITVTRVSKIGRKPKFTETQKDEIVQAYNTGTGTDELADRYGVSAQTIRRVLRERRK